MVPACDPADVDALAERFARVRLFTEELARPLSPEDCGLQSMPDASPTKWHLAHTTWFFEALVLGPAGEPPFDPAFAYLFNSYYEALGPRHARPRRGMLSRPSLAEVLAYRADVDRRVRALLGRLGGGSHPELLPLVELGLHHEQQHQELLLTDIKHAFGESPLHPAYRTAAKREAVAAGTPALGWIEHAGGLCAVGHAGAGFAFDNEEPRHPVHLGAFRLADRLVTCGELLEFIADRGYARPELWLSDGWAAARARRLGGAALLGASRRQLPPLHARRHPGDRPARARLSPQLLRGRRLRPLGRRPPPHRGRMGGRRLPRAPSRQPRREPYPAPHPRRTCRARYAAPALRRHLGVDRQRLPALSRLPPLGRRRRRVQRQVHVRADGAPGRLLRHRGDARARELPQLLPAGRALAVQRHPARQGCVTADDAGRRGG